MAKDLTTSAIERQNVLNNNVALPRIQEELGVRLLEFEGRYVLTKQMVADYYEVDIRTISRYIENNQEELEHNGYFLCKGNSLKEFKLRFAQDIDVPNKTPQIGLFDFRSFLNIGMLLTESEKAKWLRARILDIVIATINEKTGGGTKYINRRDREYLPAAIQEENYHKNLTEAVNKYVDGHKTYLRVVSSFENGVAFEITRQAKERGVLTVAEVSEICKQMAEHPLQAPYVYDARQKMASRDLAFRDVFHGNIAEYLKAVTPEEFDKFIGSKSLDFDAIMALPENQEVLKVLKQAEDE